MQFHCTWYCFAAVSILDKLKLVLLLIVHRVALLLYVLWAITEFPHSQFLTFYFFYFKESMLSIGTIQGTWKMQNAHLIKIAYLVQDKIIWKLA